MNSPPKRGRLPFLSIILPCRNEEKFIQGAISSLLSNGYPRDRMEILVVDGGSQDHSRERVRSLAAKDRRVRLLDNPRKITPAAFNIGIRAAKGSVILIAGAHSSYDPGYVPGCVKALLRTGADNAGGSLRTLPRNPGPLGRSMAGALTHPFGVGNSAFRLGKGRGRWVDTVFGGCYRKSVFDKIGLFDERLVFNQDLEFNLRLLRAGGRIWMEPGLKASYYCRSDLPGFLAHRFRDGGWVVYSSFLARGLSLRLRHLVPALFFALLLFFFLVQPALALGLGSLYLSAVLAASVHQAFLARDPVQALGLPLVFPFLHLSYALGSACGLLRGLRHSLAPSGPKRNSPEP